MVDRRGQLADEPFGHHVTKDGRVRITLAHGQP